jgi:vacuolar-type H+-ATPase subunit F/Vma7
MSQVAAIGEPAFVAGFALAGAHVLAAAGPEEVRAAWSGLPDAVAVVILTAAAAAALGDSRTEQGARLTVVMPP